MSGLEGALSSTLLYSHVVVLTALTALTVVLSLGAADPAAPADSTTGEETPSLVDRVVTKSLLDKGKSAEAKAITPNVQLPSTTQAKPDAAADLAKGEDLLTKKDGKGAFTAFRRALAKDPKSAAPLWGISRAADAMGDAKTARRYASLYVKSKAADKDKNVVAAAQWRLEQPDEQEMLTPTKPGVLGPQSTPTSATPTSPTTPGTNPLTPPPPTPY